MSKYWKFIVFYSFFAISFPISSAHSNALSLDPFNVSVGAHISTLGYGFNLSTKLNSYFGLSLESNRLYFDFDTNLGTVNYNTSLDMTNTGLTLEIHPFRNAFFVSGGYFYHRNEFEFSMESNLQITFQGQTYTASEIGGLNGTIDYGRYSPFLGIGYDSAFNRKGSWSFYFRAGILFIGKPNVDIQSTGSLADTKEIQAKIRREEESLRDAFEALSVYPVVTVGIKYRF